MLALPKIAGQGKTRTSALLTFYDNTRQGMKGKGRKRETDSTDYGDHRLTNTRCLDLARLEFDNAFSYGQNCGLGAIIDVEFMEDIADMIFDCFFTQIQDVGNFLVGFPIRD
jgi:hypothetical protein